MGTSRILALDLGASHVAAGLFQAKKGRLTLERIAAASHPPDEMPGDRWSWRVAQALATLTISRDGVDACVMILPGHLVLTKYIRTPSVLEPRRERNIRFEAAENIPLPLDEVTWSHRIVADDGRDMDVLLIASKSEVVQSLCDAAASAGFPCVDVLAGGLALREAFRYNHPGGAEPVIVANVGAHSTQLLFMAGEEFRVRTVSVGGNAVTDAVAKKLQIEFAAAEALKLQVGGGRSTLAPHSPSRAAVERAAAEFGDRLVREIRLTVANWNRQRELPAATSLRLTGGGSLMPQLPGQLAEELNLHVERFEPLCEVAVSEPVRAVLDHTTASALPELVGAVAQYVVQKGSESNLLPDKIRRTMAAHQRRVSWLAAGVLALLAPVPPLLSYHRQTNAVRARTEEVERQLAPRRALQASNEAQYRELGSLHKRIAALGPAYDARESWITLLAEFQARLAGVENVWFDRLKLEVPVRGTGSIERAPAGLESRPAEREPARLLLAGRLLDVENPQAKVSPQSYDRVKRLLKLLRESPFVAAVGGERFDSSLNGILRFEVTLVLNPATRL